jgi:hypothetical protein
MPPCRSSLQATGPPSLQPFSLITTFHQQEAISAAVLSSAESSGSAQADGSRWNRENAELKIKIEIQ